LSEVCEINPGLAVTISPDTEVSFVPMSAVDEVEGRIKSPETRTLAQIVSTSYTPFQEGDVLFAKITPSMENGKAAIASGLTSGIGFGSTEFHVIRPGEFILAEWIFALIRQMAFRDAAKARFIGSAGQQRVPARFLETFRILLPSLSEQRRIVDILSQADALRRLRCETDARMANLSASLFEDMFGATVVAQNNWPVERLKKLGEVSYGLTVNQKRRSAGNEHPYLRVGNVYRWQLDLSDLATIGTLDGDVEKYSMFEGDVLVVEGHANTKELGRAAVWDGEVQGCLHQNHILRVRPDTAKITSNYLMGFINSAIGRHHMLRYGKTSSGLYTINSTDLAKIPVVCPPIELQLQFEQRYAAYRAIDKQLLATIAKLDDLLNSFLAHTFTGELTATWREQHIKQLHDEAVQRDNTLGTRPARPRFLDFETGLVTQEEREEFTRRMHEAFVPAAEGLARLMTPQVRLDDILQIEPLLDLSQLISPLQDQFKGLIDANLYQGIQEIAESTREVLAASVRPILEMQESLQSVLAPVEQVALQITKQMAQLADLVTRRPDQSHPRYHSLGELDDKQYWLYLDTRRFERHFTATDLSESDDGWAPDFARRTLALLETLGVIVRASVPPSPESETVDYVTAYRVVQTKDDSRDDDLEALRDRYPELRV
jgi:type I restriction enzyme S subunit